jgi:hypothetical protein
MLAAAQRRHVQVHGRQSIVEVGPELPLPDTLEEIAVAGGNDPHVGLLGAAAAQPAVLAILQEAQQADLGLGGQRIHLVKEERAALGLRDQADLALASIGVGAASVAEQFVLDQMIRQRSAVDRYERAVLTLALVMDRTRRHFLATARFAGDQHGGVVARDPGENRQHRPESGRFANETIHCRQLVHRSPPWLAPTSAPDSLKVKMRH